MYCWTDHFNYSIGLCHLKVVSFLESTLTFSSICQTIFKPCVMACSSAEDLPQHICSPCGCVSMRFVPCLPSLSSRFCELSSIFRVLLSQLNQTFTHLSPKRHCWTEDSFSHNNTVSSHFLKLPVYEFIKTVDFCFLGDLSYRIALTLPFQCYLTP
jgi:hypothetical protein